MIEAFTLVAPREDVASGHAESVKHFLFVNPIHRDAKSQMREGRKTTSPRIRLAPNPQKRTRRAFLRETTPLPASFHPRARVIFGNLSLLCA